MWSGERGAIEQTSRPTQCSRLSRRPVELAAERFPLGIPEAVQATYSRSNICTADHSDDVHIGIATAVAAALVYRTIHTSCSRHSFIRSGVALALAMLTARERKR